MYRVPKYSYYKRVKRKDETLAYITWSFNFASNVTQMWATVFTEQNVCIILSHLNYILNFETETKLSKNLKLTKLKEIYRKVLSTPKNNQFTTFYWYYR